MDVYSVDKLMTKTRKVAAEYYKLTGQVLPVSNELAKYDITKCLDFREPKNSQAGIDLEGFGKWEGVSLQVKARVIFDNKNNRQRIGQLKMESVWDAVALVIFDSEYSVVEICIAKRENIESEIDQDENPKKNKKGAMSISKFKKISEVAWKRD